MSDSPDTSASRPERPGRYQRSTAGLIGAMIVTLLAVGAFVAFRSINRDDLEVRPEAVDYLAAVRALQDEGRLPVYPARLPRSWIPTSVDVDPSSTNPSAGLSWGVGILTDDDTFVGVRQSDGSLSDLLATYVDEDPTEGPTVTVQSEVATRWRTFTDSGGDTAYVADLPHGRVLVYGSATPEDLERVIGSLTAARLPD